MRKLAIATALIMILTEVGIGAEWLNSELDNGLKVMILENHQVPQVNISTTVRVGAKNETDFFDGATHFLEHLILFRGTDKMSGEELGDAMKKHGAYFNGYTSSDWTDFVISLPTENFDFALEIHADMLFRSNFPAEGMDKERQAIQEEINISEDNPFANAYRSSLKVLYGDHPYSKNVLGTKERVLNIPRDSIYAYYKRFYTPNNMTMVIVGDIDAALTLEAVKEKFGGFTRGQIPQDSYTAPPIHTEITPLTITKDVGQAYLMMSTIGPMAESPDQFPLDIMANILGSGESCRLNKKLRDDLGLVYTTGFAFYTQKYEGILFASASLAPENLEQAEKAVNEVLRDVIDNGFAEEELRKAKNSIKTNWYIGMERGLSIADRYAQNGSFMGREFVDNYSACIENVTLDELNAAAKKYLSTDAYVKTTVVPQ
jgi:predicted Zn-dependent peptidase